MPWLAAVMMSVWPYNGFLWLSVTPFSYDYPSLFYRQGNSLIINALQKTVFQTAKGSLLASDLRHFRR